MTKQAQRHFVISEGGNNTIIAVIGGNHNTRRELIAEAIQDHFICEIVILGIDKETLKSLSIGHVTSVFTTTISVDDHQHEYEITIDRVVLYK